jgi:iron complex transport system permease protein
MLVALGSGATGWTLAADDPVVSQLRLPRVLFAALLGASLAVSGAVLQALFRNPLADPGLLGVSAGGGLGAGLAIVLLPGLVGMATPMVGAMLGCLIVLGLILLLGARGGRPSMALMLLLGVGLNALCFAGVGALSFIATDDRLRELSTFMMGTLGSASWLTVPAALLAMLLGTLVLLLLAKPLDRLLLGQDEAQALGVRVALVQRVAVVACALVIGAGVAVAGVISFIGLVAPHVVRLTLGGRHALLLPASALLGALACLVADLLGRLVLLPAEVPAGLILAAIGAPAFLALLWHQRGRLEA